MNRRILKLLIGSLVFGILSLALTACKAGATPPEPQKTETTMPEFDAWMREMKLRLDQVEAEPAGDVQPKALSHPIAQPSPIDEYSIEDVHEERKRTFSQMNRLHGQLQWFPHDKQRLEASLKIIELERLNQRCWQVIDHYEATGELLELNTDGKPQPFDPAEYSAEELIRMRNNDRSYLSKAKSKGYPQEKAEERRRRIGIIEDYLDINIS